MLFFGALLQGSPIQAEVSWRPIIVEQGDARVYAEFTGSGDRAFVLLSGLGSPLSTWVSTWDSVVEELSDFGSLVRYQRVGFAPSSANNADLSADDYFEHLDALLDTYLADKKIYLVAHLIGTLFARLYEAKHADRVEGMLLVDPSPEMLMERVGIEAELVELMKEQNIAGAGSMGQSAMYEMKLQYEMEAAVAALDPSERPIVVLSSFQLPPRGLADDWGVSQSIVNGVFLQKLAIQQDIIKGNQLGLGIVSSKSGHFIHESEPNLVIDGVKWLLDKAE